MINWVDKIPDVVEGTKVNRHRLMGMQGFENLNTIFNDDGSISEISEDGTLKTTFHENNTITQVFTSTDGKVITKTTTFNEDGSISEVIS